MTFFPIPDQVLFKLQYNFNYYASSSIIVPQLQIKTTESTSKNVNNENYSTQRNRMNII